MTARLPSGADEWAALLDAAREREGGSDAPVPHDRLVETVREETDAASADAAAEWVETALGRGWLAAREELLPAGVDADRIYAPAGDEKCLYASESVEAFLLDPDTPRADRPDTRPGGALTGAMGAAVDYYHRNLSSVRRDLIGEKWGIAPETVDALRIGFAPVENELPAALAEAGIGPIAAVRSGVVRQSAVTAVYADDPEDDRVAGLPDALKELVVARAAGAIDPARINVAAVLDAVGAEWPTDYYAWWSGRIIFPYYEGGESPTDGVPRFLIARRTSQTDDLPSGGNKYLKLAVTKPWVDDSAIYEPIYGAESVAGGERLLATEGITDAIAAHQAGLACVSPVTKNFKRDHVPELLDYAEAAGHVSLVFDSEESGEGLDGALRVAALLDQAESVEATVAELPRAEGEEKVDLADYLKTNSADDLRDVLAAGVPPGEHPAFDPESHAPPDPTADADGDQGEDEDQKPDETPDPDPKDLDDGDSGQDRGTGGSSRSGLYELTLAEVMAEDADGVSVGYRGDNPISHVGQSHSEYFVYESYRGERRAHDYKSGHTYNALTWLACASGARSTKNPGGSLTDGEIWAAWRHAKEQGVLPDTDPIPWAARIHLAKEHDLAPASLLDAAADDPGTLPPSVHNRVLALVEDHYALNPGVSDWETTDRDEKLGDALEGGPDQDQDGGESEDGDGGGEEDADKDTADDQVARSQSREEMQRVLAAAKALDKD